MRERPRDRDVTSDRQTNGLRIWGSGVRISSGAPTIPLKIKKKSSPIILEAKPRLALRTFADPLERNETMRKEIHAGSTFLAVVDREELISAKRGVAIVDLRQSYRR